MAREILYRRSFHSDRDLRGMENLFDLDQALIGRKLIAERRISAVDGGLEAPRNSLDIPSGVVEMRRHSEAKCEDIPIGYELSRSLTTRRRTVEELPVKPLRVIPASHLEPEQRPRTPSVVARLMGLDAMPQDAASTDPSKKISAERHSSNHSSQRLLPSQDGRTLSKQASLSAVPSQRDLPFPQFCGDDENVPYGELSFRDHPQEKQLQQFKKEFAARQALQSRNRQQQLEDWSLMKSDTGHNAAMHEKLAEALSTAKRFPAPERLHESKEFLDALEFLHVNKDFFVKVLNDPNSLFARHLQRVSPSVAKESFRAKPDSQPKGSKFVRSFSESRKDAVIPQSFARELAAESRRKLELSQQEQKVQDEKMSSDWQSFHQGSKFQLEEEMPVRNHRRTRHISPTRSELKSGSSCDQVPTRIVVLKPNPGKCSNVGKPPIPSSSSQRENANFKMRVEGKEHTKAVLRDAKERARVGGGRDSKKEVRAAKEMARDQSKDGLKNPRDIAREIVKQVKEDMSRKLLKEGSRTWESTPLTRSSSTGGRRLSPQRVGFHGGDMSGTSDGEGYCTPSRRSSKDNGKSYSSLPNSPRLNKLVEDDQKSYSFHGKRGAHADESKRNSPKSRVSVQTPRDLSKGDLDSACEVYAFPDSCSGLDVNRVARSLDGKKSGSSQLRNNSFRETESKSTSPKILPRSHSVPTAATVENRVLGSDQKDGVAVEKATSSTKSRSAESSLFKGRFLSLKDSFSLTRKKSSKKTNSPSQDTPPSEPSEIVSPRQAFSSQSSVPEMRRLVEPKDQALSLSEHRWQADCTSTPPGDLRTKMGEAMERCLTGMLNDGSLTSIGLHQWASTTDAVDSASETSTDKCEQPSPVSVLETPFQEESPSSVDLQENDSKFPELRLKLSLLEPDYKGQVLDLQGAMRPHSSLRHIPIGLSSKNGALLPCSSTDQLLESFCVHDVPCPVGREVELVYLRDILVFSGFTRDGAVVVHSFSPDHGLDPCIFERLEHHYHEGKDSRIASSSLDAFGRRLIFDVVDDILSKRLGMPANHQPWLRAAKPSIHFMRTGKQLLEQIWAEINDHSFLHFESQEETLDDLASRDLAKDASWMHSQSDLESVGLELEQLIFNGLVEEALLDFVARRRI